jgi:hypothetical protein
LETVAKGEVAERHITAFISKRDEQRRAEEGERPVEELYAESTRRYQDGRQRARWWEWWRYHSGQAARHRRTFEALIDHHEAEASRYAALLGIDETAIAKHQENGHHA